ncbi:hypothetical protein DPMN_157566 [Dreissena polymorpha]|uniref:Secreted protein n=1 Tax=Dreissena polymorpha TaxID=45954 RepID=A0A9D4EKK8_DREPO|nr:hypothetical protein DPMN_157566 [Dreissena polymorpha]
MILQLSLLVLTAGSSLKMSTILGRLEGKLTRGSFSISQTPEIVRFFNILECTDTRESCPVTSNIELFESVVPLQVVTLATSDNGKDGEDPLVATGGRLCVGESPWIGDTGGVLCISGVWLETCSTGITLGGVPIYGLRGGVLLPANPSTMGHVLPVWGEIVPEEACLGENAEPVVMVVFRAPTLWLTVSGASSLLSASDKVTP